MRAALLCLLICALAGSAMADEIELDRLETEDLDLLYFDPPQTYLTPYAARAFLNSIEFQKRIFEWKPWEKTTLLLKDFTDSGNAAARASPSRRRRGTATAIIFTGSSGSMSRAGEACGGGRWRDRVVAGPVAWDQTVPAAAVLPPA